MAAAARQMSGAAAGLPLPGDLDKAPNNSGSSSSSDEESDDESGDRTATALPLDDSAGRTDTSGPTCPRAERHDGAGGKGKRRRGRHQGIQEL